MRKSTLADNVRIALGLIDRDPPQYDEAAALLEKATQEIHAKGPAKGGGATTLLNLVSKKYAPNDGLNAVIKEFHAEILSSILTQLTFLNLDWEFKPRDCPHATSHSSVDPVKGQSLPTNETLRVALFQVMLQAQKLLVEQTGMTQFDVSFDRFKVTKDGVVVIKTADDVVVHQALSDIRLLNSHLTHGERRPNASGVWVVYGRFQPRGDKFQLLSGGTYASKDGERMDFPAEEAWNALDHHWECGTERSNSKFDGEYKLQHPLKPCRVEKLYLAFFKNREVHPDDLWHLGAVPLQVKDGHVAEPFNIGVKHSTSSVVSGE